MFTLMLGKWNVSHYIKLRTDTLTDSSALYSSLLRIIQEEPEPHPSPPSMQTLFQGIEPISTTRQRLTGENFTVLADVLVEEYGSPSHETV